MKRCCACKRPAEFRVVFADAFLTGENPVVACARHTLRGLRNGFTITVSKISVAPVANPARKGTKS